MLSTPAAGLFSVAAIAWLVLEGCSVGVDTGDGDADLSKALAESTAHFVVLDIGRGELRHVLNLGDAIHRPEYKRGLVAFRKVAAGGVDLGQDPGTSGLQPGEAPAYRSSLPSYRVACFELTQAQWRALGGSAGWGTTDASLIGDEAVAADKPAFDLSYDEVQAVLQAYRDRTGIHLRLLSPQEWEHACRAGGGIFAWGDQLSAAAAKPYALVHETGNGSPGPAAVGSFAPNRFGLYDLHGNVWEWVAGREIRGGSWHDLLTHARAANRIDMEAAEGGHPLVGLRLVVETGP